MKISDKVKLTAEILNQFNRFPLINSAAYNISLKSMNYELN